MTALHRNNTWAVGPRPPDMNIIGCKSVYKTMIHLDGSLEWLKAHLVAKGFNQILGIDFVETFSPIIKLETIRIILTIASGQT